MVNEIAEPARLILVVIAFVPTIPTIFFGTRAALAAGRIAFDQSELLSGAVEKATRPEEQYRRCQNAFHELVKNLASDSLCQDSEQWYAMIFRSCTVAIPIRTGIRMRFPEGPSRTART